MFQQLWSLGNWGRWSWLPAQAILACCVEVSKSYKSEFWTLWALAPLIYFRIDWYKHLIFLFVSSASASVDTVQYRPSICIIPAQNEESRPTLDGDLKLGYPIGSSFARGTVWTAVIGRYSTTGQVTKYLLSRQKHRVWTNSRKLPPISINISRTNPSTTGLTAW